VTHKPTGIITSLPVGFILRAPTVRQFMTRPWSFVTPLVPSGFWASGLRQRSSYFVSRKAARPPISGTAAQSTGSRTRASKFADAVCEISQPRWKARISFGFRSENPRPCLWTWSLYSRFSSASPYSTRALPPCSYSTICWPIPQYKRGRLGGAPGRPDAVSPPSFGARRVRSHADQGGGASSQRTKWGRVGSV
jgi:hypothetical protein